MSKIVYEIMYGGIPLFLSLYGLVPFKACTSRPALWKFVSPRAPLPPCLPCAVWRLYKC